MKVVGITSCPSGVAHTYMAAEALKLSGEKLGIEVLIETQGGAGVENQLKQKDIDEAACVGCAACATMCPDTAITVER